jgi:hypothetical protein
MKPRVYKDLRSKHRYQSSSFWVTLVKKGYHPRTGAHKPTVSVADYNDYLLEAQLNAGFFEFDGWSYPVISWSLVGRVHDDRYDYTRCFYELVLGTTALPARKPERIILDNERGYGVQDAKTRHCYRISNYRCKLVKKSVNVDQSHHVIVVSMKYYHYDALKYWLKTNDVVSFNHMLYLVLGCEDIPRHGALKKDGTPYCSNNVYVQLKLKAPGRKIQYDHERPRSILDEILENVHL